MKSTKQRSVKDEQGSLQGSVKNTLIGKKKQKSPVGQRKKKSGNNNSGNSSKLGTIHEMASDINLGDRKMQHPSKIKLQLFPLDERIRIGLEKDGRNPFLELTLSSRKKISSVITHLLNKWGTSSIAIGELMLFPFNAVVENLASHKSWRSSDFGITAGDVHSAVGNPEIFRLRYGWISSPPNSSSSPIVRSQLVNIGNFSREATSTAEKQAEINRKDLVPCFTNGLRNEPVRLTALSESFNVDIHTDQAVVKDEAFKTNQANEIEDNAAIENHFSAEPDRNEETLISRELSQPSILWSDLSNISIGGLLSEASLQGRFDVSGSNRFNTAAPADSMDAFINQLNSSHASTAIDMPSSILDAEDTCHSFGFSKPLPVKDFLTLGRSAFSELTFQNSAARPSRFYNSEANLQNGANGCNEAEKLNVETLPSSEGVYNNENSLGLSSIRWNDSMGPFDLPVIPRQITKDDSISLGGFIR
ncbi:hypothetical protein vseg_005124 [Gypsophila vaccaria]